MSDRPKLRLPSKIITSLKTRNGLRTDTTSDGELGQRKSGASNKNIEKALGGYDPDEPDAISSTPRSSRTIGGERWLRNKQLSVGRIARQKTGRKWIKNDERKMDLRIYWIVFIPMLFVGYCLFFWLKNGHVRLPMHFK